MRSRAIAWSCLVLAAAGCPRSKPPSPPAPSLPAPPTARAAPADDWYPADISLPPGVEYPCAVTALPADLVGIPDEDRRYVNHVYAIVISVVREKQVLLSVLGQRDDASQARADYNTTTADALTRLAAEPVPEGLEAFHADTVKAIELLRAFFEQAVPLRTGGASMKEMHTIPEGREASQRLHAAWAAMEARYGAWSPEVKHSVYHHLCALDLF